MRTAIVVIFLLYSIPCLAEQPSVHDEELQFHVLLPDGFVALPADARPIGFPHFYITDLARPEKAVMIGIKRGGVKAGTDVALREEIALIREKVPGVELVQEKWKNLNLDCIRYVGTDPDDTDRIHFSTLIPVHPEAVMLVVSGPVDRETEVREHFRAVLSGFDARPQTSSQPVQDRFVLRNRHLVIAVLALIGIVYLVYKLRHRRTGL